MVSCLDVFISPDSLGAFLASCFVFFSWEVTWVLLYHLFIWVFNMRGCIICFHMASCFEFFTVCFRCFHVQNYLSTFIWLCVFSFFFFACFHMGFFLQCFMSWCLGFFNMTIFLFGVGCYWYFHYSQMLCMESCFGCTHKLVCFIHMSSCFIEVVLVTSMCPVASWFLDLYIEFLLMLFMESCLGCTHKLL